jgi:hypothetical protein
MKSTLTISNVTHESSGVLVNNPGKLLPYGLTESGPTDLEKIFSLPLRPSKNFIVPGYIKISRLYHAIVSSELLPPLQIAYAIPSRVTNGADVVVAPPFLSNSAEVITPFGTLLLQWHGAQDVTTAASLTSFIKEHMEGLDNMDEEEKSRLKELEDQSLMVAALYSIAQETKDPDTVRMALGTLGQTEAGRTYLKEANYQL